MKITYKELLVKLGVGRELNPYETQPWLVYSEETGITCEAEVRCNQDQTKIEAEVQFMHDKPKDGQAPVEQKCLLYAEQQVRLNGKYTVTEIWIKGESWRNRFYEWEDKSCNFFRTCVREIKAGNIPDIDDILAKEMKSSGFYGKNQGDGSNRSQKINTASLLYDMKNKGGQGF